MSLRPAVEVLARDRMPRHLPHGHEVGASRTRRRGIAIGEYRLLLDDGLLTEIIEKAAPRRLPGTRPWCRGVMNLRGNLVGVYHLEAYLENRPPDMRPPRWSLVVHTDPAWVAFGIPALPEQVAIDGDEHGTRVPALPESIGAHVHGAFRVQERLWLDVDWAGLCGAMGRDAAEHGSPNRGARNQVRGLKIAG
ncbi:MAG: chemotaxis protein CheW [Wenzhouxiangellaceae bacterium]